MTIEDVYHTLRKHDMIEVNTPVVPSPGQSIRRLTKKKRVQEKRKRPPKAEIEYEFVPPAKYTIKWDVAKVNERVNHWESKGLNKVKPDRLRWSPYAIEEREKNMVTAPGDNLAGPIFSDTSVAETPAMTDDLDSVSLDARVLFNTEQEEGERLPDMPEQEQGQEELPASGTGTVARRRLGDEDALVQDGPEMKRRTTRRSSAAPTPNSQVQKRGSRGSMRPTADRASAVRSPTGSNSEVGARLVRTRSQLANDIVVAADIDVEMEGSPRKRRRTEKTDESGQGLLHVALDEDMRMEDVTTPSANSLPSASDDTAWGQNQEKEKDVHSGNEDVDGEVDDPDHQLLVA